VLESVHKAVHAVLQPLKGVSLSCQVSKLAGLRNILIHQYIEIKNEILYQTAKETTEKIANKFIEWVKTMDPNKPSNTEKSITHK